MSRRVVVKVKRVDYKKKVVELRRALRRQRERYEGQIENMRREYADFKGAVYGVGEKYGCNAYEARMKLKELQQAVLRGLTADEIDDWCFVDPYTFKVRDVA